MHVIVAHGSATHAPAMHSCAGGQVTPVHPSMHVPPLQNWPALHVTVAHAGSPQRPLVMSHVSPVAHGWQVHESRHTPASHT